jgi:cleavage and polyadenylation specificity factor subunit 3
MMRLKSKLLSLNSDKAHKTKVFSPKNCEDLRIPFRKDKTAKVVGSLAQTPLPISEEDSQIVNGVLVQNDFKLSLMTPEDLKEYAGLTTTTITCRQKITLSAAGVDLVRWGLEGTFGSIEEVKGDINHDANGHTEDAQFLVMGCVLVRYSSSGDVELEWEGNMTNDSIADAIMAVLFTLESSPAAVKRKWFPRGQHRYADKPDLKNPRASTIIQRTTICMPTSAPSNA